MTRFFLIRHAEHDAVGRYLAGVRPGLRLNDIGRGQVSGLVARLHDVRLTAVVTSPLERTRETAEPIAADHGLSLDTEPGLIEYDVGDWTGERFATLESDDRWRRFNLLRSITRAPSGELMLEVQRRAITAVLALQARHPDGGVAIVSHGDVIRAILLFLLGMPIDFLHRIDITPARISVAELSEDGIRVLQVNGDSVPAGS